MGIAEEQQRSHMMKCCNARPLYTQVKEHALIELCLMQEAAANRVLIMAAVSSMS